jgi:hypothetical protein
VEIFWGNWAGKGLEKQQMPQHFTKMRNFHQQMLVSHAGFMGKELDKPVGIRQQARTWSCFSGDFFC